MDGKTLAGDASGKAGRASIIAPSSDVFIAILEGLYKGFMLLDTDLRMRYINEAGARFLGIDREASAGKILWEMVPKGKLAEESIREAIRTGRKASFEHIHVSGVTISFDIIPCEPGIALTWKEISDRKVVQAQLRDAQRNFSTLFNNKLYGIAHHKMVLDSSGDPIDYVFLDINETFESFTGLRRDNVIGRKVTEAIPGIKETSFDFIGKYGRIATLGGEMVEETYFEPFDRWYSIYAYSPRQNEFITLFSDITLRKKAEAGLMASEKKYRELLDTANSIIIRWRPDRTIIAANDFAHSFFGYGEGELIGKDVMITLPKKEVSGFDLRELADIIARNPDEHKLNINQNIKKDGTIVWVSWTNKAIKDWTGKITEILAIGNDITAFKQLQEDLEESEQRYRIMEDAIPFGMWMCGPDGKIEHVSQSFLDLIGKTMEEYTEMSWDSRFLPEDREKMRAIWERCLRTGEDWDAEHRILGKDGQMHHILSKGKPIKDSHGSIVSWVGVNLDITHRKLLEQEIEKSLQEKEILLKEIHHRVKNNLQIIASLLNLQSMGKDIGTTKILADSQARIRSMAIVHEMLYQTGNFSSISLKQYVERFVQEVSSSFTSGKSIEIRTDIADIHVELSSAISIGLILNELITNSLKYAFDGRKTGVISIQARKLGDTVDLTVSDDGVGLPPGLDLEKANTLGMNLVRRLVAQVGGEMEMVEGEGTSYRLHFPIP